MVRQAIGKKTAGSMGREDADDILQRCMMP